MICGFAFLAIPPGSLAEDVVNHAIAIILDAQYPDGAIPHDATRTVIIPYFSHLIAFGLVEAGRARNHEACFDAARRWLVWCNEHRDNRGCVLDFIRDGETWRSKQDADSTDSYAALELMLVQHLHVLGKAADLCTPARLQACLRAIQCTYDPEHRLTYAKPGWPFMYLMDNVEVWRGLVAAEQLAGDIGDRESQSQAESLRRAVEAGLQSFWIPEQNLYAWAIHRNGNKSIGLQRTYPDALAQVLCFDYALNPNCLGPFQKTLYRALELLQPISNGLDDSKSVSSSPRFAYWTGWAYTMLGETERAKQAKAIVSRALEHSRDPSLAGDYLHLVCSDAEFLRPAVSRLCVSATDTK